MHTTKSTRNTFSRSIESTNNWKRNTSSYRNNSLRTIVPVANATERQTQIRTSRTKPKSTKKWKHRRPAPVRSWRDRRRIIVSSACEWRGDNPSSSDPSAFIISDIDESQNLDQTVRRSRSKSPEETGRKRKQSSFSETFDDDDDDDENDGEEEVEVKKRRNDAGDEDEDEDEEQENDEGSLDEAEAEENADSDDTNEKEGKWCRTSSTHFASVRPMLREKNSIFRGDVWHRSSQFTVFHFLADGNNKKEANAHDNGMGRLPLALRAIIQRKADKSRGAKAYLLELPRFPDLCEYLQDRSRRSFDLRPTEALVKPFVVKHVNPHGKTDGRFRMRMRDELREIHRSYLRTFMNDPHAVGSSGNKSTRKLPLKKSPLWKNNQRELRQWKCRADFLTEDLPLPTVCFSFLTHSCTDCQMDIFLYSLEI